MTIRSLRAAGRRMCWALPLLGVLGCAPGRGDISGTVTYQGKPLVYGSVVFVGADGIPLVGEINPDGTYAVAGALTGLNQVTLHSPDPATVGRITKHGEIVDRPQVDHKAWFPLPEALGDPKTSGLTVIVSRGLNTFSIDVK